MSLTTLHLAKQKFKFSAAHFLIFNENSAERLHGHNYRVKVDIGVPQENTSIKENGFFVDFNVFKKYIQKKIDSWDEIVLLPAQHPEMKFITNGKSLEVTFRDRFYAFPQNEVVLLPVSNTSVEQLSRLLAEDFLREFKNYNVKKICVLIEETDGQGASTLVELAP